MTVVSLESLVRPFEDEKSYPRPFYLAGQRTPQNIKLRYGGGSSGSGKTLGTSESSSSTAYCEAYENEKAQDSGD